jgi:hypothetical protein
VLVACSPPPHSTRALRAFIYVVPCVLAVLDGGA